jgi:hypothetical protein
MNESLDAVRALARKQLSLSARVGYVALLLVAAGMSVVTGSLWMTEAALPARTQLAFGLMTGMGVAWAALATWVLRARRPLYARDRLIAGRMAVTFTAIFSIGTLIAIVAGGGGAALAACVVALAMLGMAIGALRVARRRFDMLVARRDELDRPRNR